MRQRLCYKNGQLSDEQIRLLDEIDMVWEVDDGWETGFEHASAYVKEHGNAMIPCTYECEDGYHLGTWWENQRGKYNGRRKYGSLSDEQVKRLESIGMQWENSNREIIWDETFASLKEYMEHNSADPDADLRAENRIKLLEWIRTQRGKYRNGKLEQDKIERLESIGFDWLNPLERSWETHFESAKSFYMANGNLKIPTTYKEDNGFTLGLWLWRYRRHPEDLKVTWANGDQRKRLEEIGAVFGGKKQSCSEPIQINNFNSVRNTSNREAI